MENKTGKMKLVKPQDNDLEAFFGKTKKEKSDADVWRVSFVFSKEDEKIIKQGMESLPRKYKSMNGYIREKMLEAAARDIQKGEEIAEILKK